MDIDMTYGWIQDNELEDYPCRPPNFGGVQFSSRRDGVALVKIDPAIHHRTDTLKKSQIEHMFQA